jgi:hypothetical protein
MQARPAARRAVGLARALQAGAIVAGTLPVPRDLVSYKPVLAAHVALLSGRQAAGTALREVLRELYPAALRAYPDPSHRLALAVLDALPEPGRLTVHGNDSEQAAEEIATMLTRSGAGSEDEIIAAVTALHVAISESPRRGGVNKSLAPAAAETVRHAIAAVRSCDAACAALIGTITARSTPAAASGVGRRASRRATSEPSVALSGNTGAFGRGSGREPTTTGAGPAVPRPMTRPPVAPAPVMPPPLAPRPVTPPPAVPAAASVFPNRAPAPGNRPVSVPPPPPGMTPITPGSRPAPSTRMPSSPVSSPTPAPMSAPPARPMSAPPSRPVSAPAASSISPAESGQPFRATLTSQAINSARAERQRTVIPPRPATRPSSPAPVGSPTDYSLPMPNQRPAQETSEPGSRANWPLMNGDDVSTPAASTSAPPADGRVRPPWQDMPKEPPALRLVEPTLGNSLETTIADLPPVSEPPSLRLVDGVRRGTGLNGLARRNGTPTNTSTTLTALDRSTQPPVPAEGGDNDLLIFAAARSAWFTGHTEAATATMEWANPNDTGWRAAEKAATPEVAAETAAGLPKRVPQANLVPGSPLREERPLRIVRDAASIAAHTTGYFRGWRRGQEIGGFAMGGRPGRESAGGWDFTRDAPPADEYRNNAGYSTR